MSDINNFKKQTVDPFRSNVPQTVGGTHGERRLKSQTAQQATQTPSPHTYKDQFKRGREIPHADLFGSNADYKAKLRQSKAYKPYALEGRESGTISNLRENGSRPTDAQLLGFLEKVAPRQTRSAR